MIIANLVMHVKEQEDWLTQSFAKLVTSLLEKPFMKWRFDFLGPIKPTRIYSQNKYFFVATNYVAKWVEVRALITNYNSHNKSYV